MFPVIADMYPIVCDKFQNHWLGKLEHDGMYIQQYSKGTMFVISMAEENKSKLKIDEVLSLYLIDLADGLPSRFYKLGACFI